MATVQQLCLEILDKVNSSNLDYKVNQTPYSLHVSISKKFTKVSREVLQSSSLETPESNNQDDRLRQELLNTRNEYDKLYNFYLLENQIMELEEFRTKKLFEEKEAKLQIRKELKKEKKEVERNSGPGEKVESEPDEEKMRTSTTLEENAEDEADESPIPTTRQKLMRMQMFKWLKSRSEIS